MVGTETTTSILDNTKELRVIRSHRRPTSERIRMVRVIGSILALALAAGSVIPLSGTHKGIAVAEASMAAPESFIDRGSAVDRSQRVTLTRSQRIEKVIAYAMAQRGDRYQWGADGPSSWDCSGLVSVAFKKGAGVRLPHFTGGIQKKGSAVSKKNLRRGDIVFPQRGHVGIYLGNGKMIHASSSKNRVVVATVYGFYTARRVL